MENTVKSLIACVISLLIVPPVYAAGPTSEAETIYEYNSGFYPLTLSGDGQWRFHTDDRRNVHRVSIINPQIDQKVELPESAHALSASQNGGKLAFATASGCIGIISFSEPFVEKGARDRITWLEYDEKTGSYSRDYCLNDPNDIAPGAGSYAPHPPVALSVDGQRFVVSAPTGLVMVDIATRKTLYQLPPDLYEESKSTWALQLLDNDRKLLAIKMMLGEGYESPSEGSSMQFQLWDLIDKKLLARRDGEIKGGIEYTDLLWSFSEVSGNLWRVGGGQWTSKENPDSTEPQYYHEPSKLQSINFKTCDVAGKQVFETKGNEWLDFTADPSGRWLAAVEAIDNVEFDGRSIQLTLFNAKDGSVVAQWPLQTKMHSLRASNDGNWLFATTSGEKKEGDYDAPYQGGGEVISFPLTDKIKPLSAVSAAAWAAHSCLPKKILIPESELPYGIFPAETLRKQGIEILVSNIPTEDSWRALVCVDKKCDLHSVDVETAPRLARGLVKASGTTPTKDQTVLTLLRGKGFADHKNISTYLTELMPHTAGDVALGSMAVTIATPTGEYRVLPRLRKAEPMPEKKSASEEAAVDGEGESESAVAEEEKTLTLYLENKTQRQSLGVFGPKAMDAVMKRTSYGLVAWAGDLDDDGKLDLITREPRATWYFESKEDDYDAPDRFRTTVLHLWLSSLADENELVGHAAALDPSLYSKEEMESEGM